MEQEFKRQPRVIRQRPSEEIILPEPPCLPDTPRQRLSLIIAPLLSAFVYAFVTLGRGTPNLLMSLPMLGMSLITAGMAIYNLWEQRKLAKRDRQALDNAWITALHATDQQLQSLWQRQQTRLHTNDPLDLTSIITQPQSRLWERQPSHPDFLCVRIGIGDQPSSTMHQSLHKRATSPYEIQLQRVIKRYATIPDVPLCLDLQHWDSIGIVGRHATQSLSNLIWNIVTHHSPQDVRLMMFWPKGHDRLWDWMRFLPHTAPLSNAKQYRWLGHSDSASHETLNLIHEAEQLLLERQNNSQRHPIVVIIIADHQPIPELQSILERQRAHGSGSGIIGIQRSTTPSGLTETCKAYLDTNTQPSQLALTGPEGGYYLIRLDAEVKHCDYLARTLSQWHYPNHTSQTLPTNVRLTDLLKIEDAAIYDPAMRWNTPPPPDDLHPSGLWPIPIGSAGNTPKAVTMLDLNEKREGVHGMIAGTTGAGKSELLSTILIGLALFHHPDRLNFLLIDFKGGATFRDLALLPHTAGLVTDLSGNQAERALIAINSELDRRKQHLSGAGVPNIKTYRRTNGSSIPNLLIVIDEFDEMARDYPEMIDELIRVAKQGRSLGVHLLFATQTPSNGAIKPGLRTNLTYWIALRVVDPEDSKLMIDSHDAATIPNKLPGRAYKRVGNAITHFQSAIVTNPYQPPIERTEEPFFLLDSLGRWQAPSERIRNLTHQSPAMNPCRSEADVLIERLCQSIPTGYAAGRYRIWQPPLQSNLIIRDLPIAPSNLLRIIIGLADHPEQAQHQPFAIDFTAVGNVVIFGSSGAGKTSALRTIMLQLCQTTSPANLHCYIIDAQGEGLGLGNDPQTRPTHIADAISISDGERIERLWAFLDDEISRRQAYRRQAGIEYWHPAVESHQTLPALMIVIDPLAELVEQYPSTLAQISRLMRNSRANGIFWLISNDRQAPQIFPADLRSGLGLKIVLRLSNEHDSIDLLNKPQAARLRQNEPGRGFVASQGKVQEIQIAYPTLQTSVDIKDQLSLLNVLEEFRTASQSIISQWKQIPTEQCGQPLRLLPSLIIAPNPPESDQKKVFLATEHRTLAPIGIDFTQTPYWLIAGPPRSGKTILFRTMLKGLLQPNSQLFLIDYQASLREFTAYPQTIAYATESGSGIQAFGSPFIDLFETTLNAARTAVFEADQSSKPIVLAIANIDLLEPADLNQLARWGKWFLQGHRLGLACLISGNDFATVGSHGLIKVIKQERCAAVVGNAEINPTNLGLSSRALRWPTALEMVPGRGFLVITGEEHVVQYWLPQPQQKENGR